MDTEALRARREDRRRTIRRRRQSLALIAGAAIAVAAIALATVGGGGSSPVASAPHATQRGPRGARGGLHSTADTTSGTGVPGTQSVPILMYHVINPPPAGAPFPGLYVPPEEFAEQMQALKAAGWHAVTLDQVEAYWRHGTSLGAGKPIVLSFDNGYQSQYTNALPVLRRLGWVGDENMQLSGLPPSQGGLGQEQIRGLLAAGWELDTQGFSHADLITLGAEELHYQVAVARRVMQQRYGVPVNWFCYPSGHYDATVIAAVAAAGYTGSTTVIPGWAGPGEDPYRLPRLRVLGGTSASALLSQVASAREEPAPGTSYGG